MEVVTDHPSELESKFNGGCSCGCACFAAAPRHHVPRACARASARYPRAVARHAEPRRDVQRKVVAPAVIKFFDPVHRKVVVRVVVKKYFDPIPVLLEVVACAVVKVFD